MPVAYIPDSSLGPNAESLGIGIFTSGSAPSSAEGIASDANTNKNTTSNCLGRRQSSSRVIMTVSPHPPPPLSGVLHRLGSSGNLRRGLSSRSLFSSNHSNTNHNSNKNYLDDQHRHAAIMKKWRIVAYAVIAARRLVFLGERGLKQLDRDWIQDIYFRYISSSSSSSPLLSPSAAAARSSLSPPPPPPSSSKISESSATFTAPANLSPSESMTLPVVNGGPIDSEAKLVHFLRAQLGFVGVVDEEEKRCGCSGVTIRDLLQYEINVWPIRLCVLSQVIGRLIRQDEWQQQNLAAKNPNLGINSVPLGKLLFEQLAIEIPRDDAKSMRRKRKREQLSGNAKFVDDYPAILPSSSSDSSGNDEDEDEDDHDHGDGGDRFDEHDYHHRHQYHYAKNDETATKEKRNRSSSAKAYKQVLRRVDAALLVQMLETFQFPSNIVDLFRARAASHPWLTQKAVVQIFDDPLANAASVAKLSALTQSITYSSIQAKRAKDRVQDASAALVSVLWRRLAGGGGGGAGGGGAGNSSIGGNNSISSPSSPTAITAEDAEKALASLFDHHHHRHRQYQRHERRRSSTTNNKSSIFFSPTKSAPSSPQLDQQRQQQQQPQSPSSSSAAYNLTATTTTATPAATATTTAPLQTQAGKPSPSAAASTRRLSTSTTAHQQQQQQQQQAKNNVDDHLPSTKLQRQKSPASAVDRETWKRKMDSIFGDARPPPRKMMAEFRFVELSTPRRHQQHVKSDASEIVGFATSEQRWWLRGMVPAAAAVSNNNNRSNNNGNSPGRHTPHSNVYSSNRMSAKVILTRKEVFANQVQQHLYGSSASRPVSARGGGGGGGSSCALDRNNSHNQNNNNNNPSRSRYHQENSSLNSASEYNNIDNNNKPTWHVSSARVEGAPNPPLPLPGTPRRERDREGKKLPPPRPKWSKVNPFVDGRSWDDV